MSRDIHDHYFKEAKREGYLSRAAYKLIEIDDRKRVLSKGDAVLDCGAAPGSWMQVASKRVGRKGVVVGIDLKPTELESQDDNIFTIQGDFREISAEEMLASITEHGGRNTVRILFDVVISDMAPGTTGVPSRDHFRSVQLCETLLDRLPPLLKAGGNLVVKVFEGEQYPELLKRIKSMFEASKGFKPKATRNESVEMYIIGHGFKPIDTSDSSENLKDVQTPIARGKPTGGWGKKK